MNYCWTTFYVKDLQRSVSFYQEVLGLEIRSKFHTGDATEIVMLGKENATLVELVCNQKLVVSTSCLSMGFEVEGTLEETMEQLKQKGIPVIRGPISPVPSMNFLFIKDPDGVEIQLVQHVRQPE